MAVLLLDSRVIVVAIVVTATVVLIVVQYSIAQRSKGRLLVPALAWVEWRVVCRCGGGFCGCRWWKK